MKDQNLPGDSTAMLYRLLTGFMLLLVAFGANADDSSVTSVRGYA